MKYSPVMRVLHWLMALLILGLIAAGWFMTGLDKNDTIRGTIYALHKSLGVTVLGLVILRVLLRLITVLPPLPDAVPPLQQRLAKAGHVGLYLVMLLVPVLGIAMSQSYGYGVKWFGLLLPTFFTKDSNFAGLMGDWHAWLAYTMLTMVLLHVLAVLKHWRIDGVNLLRRMW